MKRHSFKGLDRVCMWKEQLFMVDNSKSNSKILIGTCLVQNSEYW